VSGNPFFWVKCGHATQPEGSHECHVCLRAENAALKEKLKVEMATVGVLELAGKDLNEKYTKLREALENMLDNEACDLDHDGFCQSHASSSPCVMAEARKLLHK